MPLDPHSLAIGLAALAGGGVGLAVLLFVRNRALHRKLQALHERATLLAKTLNATNTERRRIAAVWHVNDIRTGFRLEQLASKMCRRTDSG